MFLKCWVQVSVRSGPRAGTQNFTLQRQLSTSCRLEIIGSDLADGLDEIGMIRGAKSASCTAGDIRLLE